ncbi:hypothetical protein UVI_02038860 [Ustilaginoidea virens]|uniref:Uncharacterized protein n=1 Tax=Ustilaginoidea virens TaxID=1159556 RepID=A0A063C1R3_USTVR|nr:hypothetical protein UVI_02038860 [Ustilaginoidea virens]
MKVSSTTLVLATALGVAAHPSGHAHRNLHRSMEKRTDYVMAKKPADVQVNANLDVSLGSAQPPAASSAGQSQSTTPDSPVSGVAKKFCTGSNKRATAAQIAYKGNVGTTLEHGCNLMMVDNAALYDYTATFENKSGKDQTCVVFLKIGPTGLINGFQKGNEIITFKLPANSKKVLAAEANSQGGAACSPGDAVKTNQYGQWGATWLEFDFANESNGGHSGADASCLVPASAGLPIQAMTVCGGDKPCSVINNGGTGTNAYLQNMEAFDGVGLNFNPGPVALNVTIG